jgi:hypothetical protein
MDTGEKRKRRILMSGDDIKKLRVIRDLLAGAISPARPLGKVLKFEKKSAVSLRAGEPLLFGQISFSDRLV